MSFKTVAGSCAFLATAIGCWPAQNANAAGIEVTVTTEVTDERGISSGGIALFLNGEALPLLPVQQVVLGLGDVLLAEVQASATHESGTSSAYGVNVSFDFVNDAGTASAAVQTRLAGSANSAPESAQGSIGQILNCDFMNTGCAAPGLPLSLSFFSGADSSTFSLVPNAITIHNATTPTGRVGGVEEIDLATSLILDRALGSPEASTTLRAVALALFQSTTTAGGSLEMTVTDLTLTAVPAPAVGWLLVPALFQLGRLRRRVGHPG